MAAAEPSVRLAVVTRKVGAAARAVADRDPETAVSKLGLGAERAPGRSTETSSGKHTPRAGQQVLGGENSFWGPERLQLSADKVQSSISQTWLHIGMAGGLFFKSLKPPRLRWKWSGSGPGHLDM